MSDAHNAVRTRVSVAGLLWSDELASFAQQWADYLATQNHCRTQHRPKGGEYVQRYGENLYWASAITWSDGRKAVRDIKVQQVLNSWAFEAFQEKRQRENDEAETQSSEPIEPDETGARLEYRLATNVPDYWVPLVPVQAEDVHSNSNLERFCVAILRNKPNPQP